MEGQLDLQTPLRLAGVIRESVVDGPGWRFVVFAQGCPHHCEGCQNPQTHDFKGGYDSNVGNIISEVKKNPLLAGVTLSGGEPFSQAAQFAVLARCVHNLGLNVITFSGWTIEQLMDGMTEKPEWRELLEETDILMDGKFVLKLKTLSLKFRGSSNQRSINPRASLEHGRAVLCDI